MAKHTALCRGVQDNGTPCTAVGNCARGYCEHCYHILRDHCIRNGSWKPGMDISNPVAPKWEYEPSEQQVMELEAMLEKQDREKSEEQQNA